MLSVGVLFLTSSAQCWAADGEKISSIQEIPGGMPYAPASVKWDAKNRTIEIEYGCGTILKGTLSEKAKMTTAVKKDGPIEQRIVITSKNECTLKAVVNGGDEAITAETRGEAQKRFPIVRTTHGVSSNLRNNAVYDRKGDWMIEMPEGTIITPARENNGAVRFDIVTKGKTIELVFRPRFYQRHKNIASYQPWTYSVRKDSITGWNSWFSYMHNFNQQHLQEVLKTWQEKKLADYGYRFIQVDDVYQGGKDGGRKAIPGSYSNYSGGRPETWLEWKSNFPDGMTGFCDSIRKAGLEPSVWVSCMFTDVDIAQEHPDWFVQDKKGKPSTGPFIGYAMDATNPEVDKTLIRPTYRGLHNAGVSYVKIDILRHYLYDNMNKNIEYFEKRGIKPAEMFRAYLRIAREELGPETLILGCWGVLPESVGYVDACRIGGDGYGPVTMQQYNSWNGIVWRNDPDLVDVFPKFKPAEVGNVRKFEEVKATNSDTIIRPALASIAGCLLMLADKMEVFKDDNNLVGLRRSSPVLFTVPGQLYDFDPIKSDRLCKMNRLDVKSGSGVSPIDGDQYGAVCPWWLNEINLPFENWYVLHRINWSQDKDANSVTVTFADLGLDAQKEYLVYEFWSNTMLGILKGSMELPTLHKKALAPYSIREKLDRPQIISTNRHLTQGAVELETLTWSPDALSGRSRMVADDRYVITVYVPNGYKIGKASFDDLPGEVECNGAIAKVSFMPKQTDSVGWKIEFTH